LKKKSIIFPNKNTKNERKKDMLIKKNSLTLRWIKLLKLDGCGAGFSALNEACKGYVFLA